MGASLRYDVFEGEDLELGEGFAQPAAGVAEQRAWSLGLFRFRMATTIVVVRPFGSHVNL